MSGSATHRASSGAPVRGVRKSSERRRSELIAAAQQVFAGGPVVASGVADLAAAAGVSRGLLYHYFPGGRPEIAEAVAEELLDGLCERMADAGNLPFSPLVRLEHMLAALFGFFSDRPLAYRLLVAAEGDESVNAGTSQLAKARIVSQLAPVLAASGRRAPEVLAMSNEMLALVVSLLDTCDRGDREPEAAWRAACRDARRRFRRNP